MHILWQILKNFVLFSVAKKRLYLVFIFSVIVAIERLSAATIPELCEEDAEDQKKRKAGYRSESRAEIDQRAEDIFALEAL